MPSKLGLYDWFSRLSWPKSYLGKFLLSAFVGVHIPLIALVVYVAASLHTWEAAIPFVLVALGATLFGTLATQFIQAQLLKPILRTSSAIANYVDHRAVPELPNGFTDEAGVLMSNAQTCILQLDGTIRMKNNLLATASHDTRTPITTILTACSLSQEILNSEDLDVDELRYMNGLIRDSARRQLDLMNGILAIARADTGKLEPSWSRTTPGSLLISTIESAEFQAKAKGVALRIDDDAHLEEEVVLDAPKTEQVLNNLVTNAIKFTRAGGTVEIGSAIRGEWIELTVSDTGIGMSRETIEELFTPFTSAQRTGTANEAGTGLGLWICKTFTEVQGGTLDVRSEPDRGTTFTVRIPRGYRVSNIADRAPSVDSRLERVSA